jgi:hypothetical protein
MIETKFLVNNKLANSFTIESSIDYYFSINVKSKFVLKFDMEIKL